MGEIIKILKALGSEPRIKIMLFIKKYKSVSAVEVADHISVTQPAASRHLQVLERVGCIKRNRVGQYVISKFHEPPHSITRLVIRLVTKPIN